MTRPEDIDRINPDNLTLVESILGYDILLEGKTVGTIEGILGKIDHIEVKMHWEEKGIGRAALNEFIELSQAHGVAEVTTNNAVHPAMEHILETEGFEEQTNDVGWRKDIC